MRGWHIAIAAAAAGMLAGPAGAGEVGPRVIAADTSVRYEETRVELPDLVEVEFVLPYRVVHQGPDFSGPGITVEPAPARPVPLLPYPFIGEAVLFETDEAVPAPRGRPAPLRRLGAAGGKSALVALASARRPPPAEAARPPRPTSGVFHARAEVRLLGPDRIDIKLYRDQARASARGTAAPVRPTAQDRNRILRRALRAQQAREQRRAARAYRADPVEEIAHRRLWREAPGARPASGRTGRDPLRDDIESERRGIRYIQTRDRAW